MKPIVLLLAIIVVPNCATGQQSEYKGQGLADWIAETRPEKSFTNRREGIQALEEIARRRSQQAHLGDPAACDWIAREIIPTLHGLLKDRQAAVREDAALAISRIDPKASEATIPALTELLADPVERIRNSAAAALSYHGPAAEPAIPTLVNLIRQDSSKDIQHNAAIALRTAGQKGVDALLELLDEPSTDVRRVALSMFQGRLPRGQPYLTPAVAAPKLVALLADDDAEIRKSAAKALAGTDGVPAEAIAKALHHEDVAVRRAAGYWLLFHMHETKRLQDEMVEFMEGDMAFCQDNASLLSRAGPKSMPVLLKLLDDPSPAVRGYAASALGDFGPAAKEAVVSLKRLLTDLAEIPRGDLDDRVCHHAASALNRILGDKDYGAGLPKRRPDGK